MTGLDEKLEENLDEKPAHRNGRIAKTLMVQGTASDVGKSWIVAALCRIFAQDGLRTAPFKSQNMSNNAYVTVDGKEIGRAQGMQADACGIMATTDMNPILLKPTKEMSSQVVVHGKPLREYEAREYRESYLPTAGRIVREALGRLRGEYDIVVMEGAGSPAEINLKDRDIVNMRMAAWADAPVILAADIDRGGVFASIVGTLELLEPEERDRIRGFIINKFRGDVSLLKPGLDWLEERTGKPVLGVLPFLPGLALEDEDSLSLSNAFRFNSAGQSNTESDKLDVAVIGLPRIANFTDADPLRCEPDVRLRIVQRPEEWGKPDIVILPGSKNTAEDLAWLRDQGLADCLKSHLAGGGRAAGICGGYEMLGHRLLDPDGVESDRKVTEGLGFFPFEVLFNDIKRTVRVEGNAYLWGNNGAGKGSAAARCLPINGYEIHMGSMHPLNDELIQPFRIRECGSSSLELSPEGACTSDGRLWGTFVHGILHNDDFRRAWLNEARADKGLAPLSAGHPFQERRQASFDRLAAHAREHLNLPLIYKIAGLESGEGNRDGSAIS
ncbi:cobyric acid synthase [Paenibacillus nanensis]|uniref:cobyric acid synthase n=1 Tax=Paenibacillus nanensis TaxID=393251 RepID=UPI0013C316FE|nr:cobyric acid synthase [Paenibacillus nanensis]